MEPRIQYATTADGVSIAFWTLGEGMPFVQMPSPPFSHIQLEWQLPGIREWYERLAERRKLVRYDGRGSGLSDRDVTDYSLDAHVLDVEAVIDRLGLEKFALMGWIDSGPPAVAYAARHPERVSHLVLWCTYARSSDVTPSPEFEAELALRDKNWELYTEMLAHVVVGWSEGEQARRLAAMYREMTTPDAVQESFARLDEVDVTAVLPQVKSPTLVFHRRQLAFYPVSVVKGLASRIPNARLVLLEGSSLLPFPGDTEAACRPRWDSCHCNHLFKSASNCCRWPLMLRFGP